jgi:hypothetical protein
VRAKDKSANEGDLSEKRQRKLAAGVLKQAASTACDFSTCFALLSPLIGIVVGFLSLLVFAR